MVVLRPPCGQPIDTRTAGTSKPSASKRVVSSATAWVSQSSRVMLLFMVQSYRARNNKRSPLAGLLGWSQPGGCGSGGQGLAHLGEGPHTPLGGSDTWCLHDVRDFGVGLGVTAEAIGQLDDIPLRRREEGQSVVGELVGLGVWGWDVGAPGYRDPFRVRVRQGVLDRPEGVRRHAHVGGHPGGLVVVLISRPPDAEPALQRASWDG